MISWSLLFIYRFSYVAANGHLDPIRAGVIVFAKLIITNLVLKGIAVLVDQESTNHKTFKISRKSNIKGYIKYSFHAAPFR